MSFFQVYQNTNVQPNWFFYVWFAIIDCHSTAAMVQLEFWCEKFNDMHTGMKSDMAWRHSANQKDPFG